ncbi:MAG TPA: hypothetical protein VGE21_00945 [Flavobacteriales bacterium]
MDHIRPSAIAIPLETWLADRGALMESFGHRQHPVPMDPVERFLTLLTRAKRAIIDILRGK